MIPAPARGARRIARTIDYLGQLGARLRDLQGFATLAFELTQNADDVSGATYIRFDVRDDALVVDNDGTFSRCGDPEGPVCLQNTDPPATHLCDFHRFREVAAGDKRDEQDTSGAFGFGFTAVYQVTDRPHLLSGGHHWTLEEERPEAERVLVCDGGACPVCGVPGLPGTRFILPWARDPGSELRVALRSAAVDPDAPERFLEEVAENASTALIFLRRLRRIEICRNGQLVLRVDREVDEEQGLLLLEDSRGEAGEWILVKGEFAEDAGGLRALHGARIEPKRSHEVRVAIRREPVEQGVFCAFLPTRQSVGMPLHLHADFFPSNDRKRIQLGSDFQGEWNRTAIRAAARALAGAVPRLTTELGHRMLWNLFAAAEALVRDVEDGRREPGVEVLWQELSKAIPTLPVVYTSAGDWRSPREPVYRVESPDSALDWLSAIGIDCVHRDLRPYYNLLTRVGIPLLDAEPFVSALRTLGLDRSVPLERWPAPVSADEGLAALWGETERMLARHRSAEAQATARRLVSGCAVALGRDGALHPAEALFRDDEETAALFERVRPEARFASAENPEPILGLCAAFKVGDAVTLLERGLNDGGCPELDPTALLAWFQSRLPELRSDSDARRRLKELPVFPGGDHELHPLDTLVLAGGFEDSLGLAAVLDERRAGRVRPLLEALGAQELTLSRYASQLLPRPFENRTDGAAVIRALAFLAAHREALQQIGGFPGILAEIPLVPCRDGVWRAAGASYFDVPAVTEVLDGHAALAELPSGVAGGRALLEWLGVGEVPRLSDCVARIRDLVALPPREAALGPVRAVFRHLGERVRNLDALPRELEPLLELRWLPSRKEPDRWLAPAEVHASYQSFVYESQACFLDIPLPVQNQSAQLIKLLRIASTPTLAQIVSHLLYSAEAGIPVNLEVYRRLDDSADHREIERLQGKACILLPGGRYVEPANVYWSAHPFGPYRVHLGEALHRFGRLFEAIGVRQEPEATDAVRVLKEVARSLAEEEACEAATIEIVLGCWRMIEGALEDQPTLAARLPALLGEVPSVPVDAGCLLPPSTVFFEDRAGLAAPFGPEIQSRSISRIPGASGAMMAAGVRSLAAVVETRLLEAGNPFEFPEIAELVEARRNSFSRIFNTFDPDTDPRTPNEAMASLTFFRVSTLTTQPVLPLVPRELRGSAETPTAHLHAAMRVVYFRQAENRIPWTGVAREIALLLFPEDEPGQIASALKEVLTASSEREAEDVLDELGFAPLQLHDVVELEDEVLEELGGEEGPQGSEGEDDPSRPTGQEGPSSPTSEAPAAPPAPPAAPPGKAHPRRRPQPAKKRKPRPQSRLLTYVVPEAEDEDGSDTERPGEDPVVAEHRKRVDAAGVQLVREYEERRGRTVQVMPPGNPGYDLISEPPEGEVRFIEVKSTAGSWAERGVGLSHVQFGEAWNRRGEFWLYVVERALEPVPIVYAIRNPARRVREFMYDGNWRELAETEPENGPVSTATGV